MKEKKLILFSLSCFALVCSTTQCNTNTSPKTNNKDTTTIQIAQNIVAPETDTIKLLNVEDFKISELIARKLIDTSVTSEERRHRPRGNTKKLSYYFTKGQNNYKIICFKATIKTDFIYMTKLVF